MESNSVSPLPPPEAPLAMMETEKTPPGTPLTTEMPPPPDEKTKDCQANCIKVNIDDVVKGDNNMKSINQDFVDELNRMLFRKGPTRRNSKRYEEDSDNVWNCCSWFEYLLIIILSTILLVGVLVLTLFWVMFYRGGLAWSDNPALQFNLHPILMIAGFVTLSGFSILIYRLCRCLKKIYVKLAHMFFHACAIPCVALGFLSVFESHNALQKINFESLHSWLGLVTMGMFAMQFIIGFFSFLVLLCCENKTYKCRSAMVPIHASFGVANFWLAILTGITGLIEKGKHSKEDPNLSDNNRMVEEMIMSVIGIVLVIIGVIVTFAVRRSNAPTSAKVYVTERI